MEGGCACGAVRYRLTSEPMFVHCCHCLNCQRQTGSAFVITDGWGPLGMGADYRLGSTSPFRTFSTDGTGVGANIDVLSLKSSSAISGN